MTEIVGFIASITIVISFLMNNEKGVRFFNTVGSLVFILYGFMNGAPSIIILNIASIVINAIKIYKISMEEKSNETDENRN